ncbi:MAG TPA: Gfo/Idh/MocA family oxidoreductase [Terriglobales bacterium]|jgi:predicted dehydrogenase|nr:Gfo/Idh/MocA family oxidoreductase [Terriglobales bacterium]
MQRIKVAVVGGGYWGQNLIRNFWEVDEAELTFVCDLDPKPLARAQRRYPTIQVTRHYRELLNSPRVDAIVLATPVSTHYEFARQALLAGKHVLVEKPLARSTDEVLDLMELAERQRKLLMVDHTFLYTSAVRRIREAVDEGGIGELLYFDSVRINLGLVQSDINVMWDLAPHDFSILNHICDSDPVAVSAVGARHLGCPYENIAYITALYDSSLIAHIHVNWLSPVKVRTTLVGGSSKMIVYDDMESSEKIKVYDRGFTVNHDPERRQRLLTGYRNGDMQAPNLENTEALRLMARDFVCSILENRSPLSDALSGYRVVRFLEAAQQSIEKNGREVVLLEPAISRTPKLVSMRA